MEIPRLTYLLINSKIQENKVILLYGPRCVGKTTYANARYEIVTNDNFLPFIT